MEENLSKLVTLDPEQVAELLDLSYATVLRLLHTGQIPGRQVGRRWKIPKAAFEQWMMETPHLEK